MSGRKVENNQPKDLNSLLLQIRNDLKNYVNHRLRHYRLDILEKTSKYSSQLVVGLLIGFFTLAFFSFALIGCALYIGELFGSSAIGFGVVALLWLFLLILVLLFRKPLMNMLLNKTVKLLYRIEKEVDADAEK